MSCSNEAYPSVIVWTVRGSARSDRPTFWRVLIMIYESFQEALAMRRDAYRRYRLTDE
jgi:hypothetical protein